MHACAEQVVLNEHVTRGASILMSTLRWHTGLIVSR
jgi:hypothetical protein